MSLLDPPAASLSAFNRRTNALAPRSMKTPGIFKASSRNVSTLTFIGSDTTAGVTFHRNPTNIFLSTDNGATISTGKGLPTGVTNGFSVERVTRCFGLWWCIAQDAGDSLYKVYSAPVVLGNTALTWTLRFTLGNGATNIFGALGASADGLTLCICEYSANASTPGVAGGIKVYRTTNGTTFTTSATATTAPARHWHSVQEDPYNPGTWYAALGDGTVNPLWKSTDNGNTFAAVSSVGAGWDGIDIFFDANWIYLTGDSFNGANVAPFYVLDRTTLTPQVGCSNSPYMTPVVNAGVYASGSVTSASNVLAMGSLEQPVTVDDIGRKILVKRTSDSVNLVPDGTTITAVASGNVTMSNVASATSAAITYMVDRQERYFPLALHGCVDPSSGIVYIHADNAGAAPIGQSQRMGLFMCPVLFGPLVPLDNPPSASRGMQVVNGTLHTGINYRPAIASGQAVQDGF